MTTNREGALGAIQAAWNGAGELPNGKMDVGEFARTMALAGIGFALLDIAAAIRGDTGEQLNIDGPQWGSCGAHGDGEQWRTVGPP